MRTTVPDETAARPADLVCRLFAAARPDQLWVADITYVRTWAGFCYAAFVIDVFFCMVVGWPLSTSLKTGMPPGGAGDGAVAPRPSASQAGASTPTAGCPR